MRILKKNNFRSGAQDAVRRQFDLEVSADGELMVTHSSGMVGISATTQSGWVWNIFANETDWRAEKFGGAETQYEAWGTLLSKMFELTT